MTRRVVVTGIGLVTSIGSKVETFWSALLAGRSGIKKVTSFDTKDFTVFLGGEVVDFSAEGIPSRIGDSHLALSRLDSGPRTRAAHFCR